MPIQFTINIVQITKLTVYLTNTLIEQPRKTSLCVYLVGQLNYEYGNAVYLQHKNNNYECLYPIHHIIALPPVS